MQKPQVESKVIEIVSEQFGVDKIELSANTSLKDDLGGDSLDAVELVIQLEDQFEVVIDDVDAEELKTVGDIVTYIIENTK